MLFLLVVCGLEESVALNGRGATKKTKQKTLDGLY